MKASWLKAVLMVAGVSFGANAEAGPPGWCKAYGGRADRESIESALQSENVRDAVASIVVNTCFPEDEAKKQAKELEAARQKIGQRLNMSEDAWADAAEWTSGQRSSRSDTYPSNRPARDLAFSAHSPTQQYYTLIYDDLEINYKADVLDAKLTETGRLGYIFNCIKPRNVGDRAVQWAMCQGDIDAYDPKKIPAELKADQTASGFDRMIIRFMADRAAADLKAHAESVKQLIAKDEAYGKVFEAAKQGRKAFATVDAKLIAAALAMDDARVTESRKAYAGCLDKTWPALTKAIAALPAAKFGNMNADPDTTPYPVQAIGVIVGDPVGYLTANSYFICSKNESDTGPFANKLASAMMWWPGFRGPRTAAHSTILNAGIELDKKDAKLDFPTERLGWMGAGDGKGDYGRGVVGGVKVTGDTATITFAPKMEQQSRCTASKRTNRITRIDSSGNLIYETICTASKSVTVNTASSPVTVGSRFLGGLKVGMNALVYQGAVQMAWAKNGAKLPSIVLGTAVK